MKKKRKDIRDKFMLYTGFVGSICSILGLIFVIFPLSKKVDNLQLSLDQRQAESVIMSYFAYIENGDYEKAYNLFSDEKKRNHTYEGFKERLNNFVAFEGLKIVELPEKNSVIQKVYLSEFGFKERGKLSVQTKRGFYVRYNGDKDKWEINYSNVIYDENGWTSGACNFYNFDICG